jgi:hypothetical protein
MQTSSARFRNVSTPLALKDIGKICLPAHSHGYVVPQTMPD